MRRTQLADDLAGQSKALRRWESYRFGSWASELHKVREEDSESNINSDSQSTESETSSVRPETQRALLESAIWVLVLVQLGIWTGKFLPSLMSFMESADTSRLSEPLSILCLFFSLGLCFGKHGEEKFCSSVDH